jgi:hypothetical protein
MLVQKAGVSDPYNIELVQCTPEHWTSLPSVLKNFDTLEMSGWLCPVIGA